MRLIKMTGGLGNQMFIYAFYLKMKKLFPHTKIDLSDMMHYHVHHGYEMNRVFALPHTEFCINRTLKKLMEFLLCKVVYERKQKNGSMEAFEKKYAWPLIYFKGFYQSERFFADIEDDVRKTFCFNMELINIRSREMMKVTYALCESLFCWRRPSHPILYMTLLVKNEEELLEQNLIFHKQMGVDGFIVTDNNSTDHTPDILRKYKELGWIKEIIQEPATDYRQKKWVDRMVWCAKTIFHANWVINADADEFWYAPSGNLKSGLKHVSDNVIKCAIRNMYPEEGKSFREWKYVVDPVTDTDKYDLSPYSLFGRQIPKVMHRTRGYIQISMGNHKVAMFPKRSGKSDIRIYHYNIRGRQQFLEKMINGGKQLEQNPSKHGGRHWRYFYGLYKEGKLNEEYDRVIGSRVFDRLQADGYIHEDHTMADFFKNLNK